MGFYFFLLISMETSNGNRNLQNKYQHSIRFVSDVLYLIFFAKLHEYCTHIRFRLISGWVKEVKFNKFFLLGYASSICGRRQRVRLSRRPKDRQIPLDEDGELVGSRKDPRNFQQRIGLAASQSCARSLCLSTSGQRSYIKNIARSFCSTCT